MRRLLSALACLAASAAAALAQQCEHWLPSDGFPGVVGDTSILCGTTWDPDGPGPSPEVLVVGGMFRGAGDVAATNIATWDGARWSALGQQLNHVVRDLVVFNGELYAAAGGAALAAPQRGVARWNGTEWVSVGGGFSNTVWSLEVHNGTLIAAGLFNNVGGTPAANVAQWNGASWQPMGAGLPGGVFTTFSFQGELYAGTPTGVKRWTGVDWQPFGSINYRVLCFGVYNGELIAGGGFTTPVNRIARWDGADWQPFGSGMSDEVQAIKEFNGNLVAGGIFTNAGGSTAIRLAQWNGFGWSALGGMRQTSDLVVYNNELIVIGAGTQPSGNMQSLILRYDGSTWNYLGSGFDEAVYTTASFRGDLIAGGNFSQAGNAQAVGIARRDPFGQWHSMGDIFGGNWYVWDAAVYNDDLIITGSFDSVGGAFTPHGAARWDGESWSAFGDAPISKMLVTGGELYAPGNFGGNQHVARWNDADNLWEPLGEFVGLVGISCLAMHGGDLYAAGVGGLDSNGSVWRWDFDSPGTWQPVGQHMGTTSVECMASYNGFLYIGGSMGTGFMRLEGNQWVGVGGGIYNSTDFPDEVLKVFDMEVRNGELVIAGTFSYVRDQQYTANALRAPHVASWNGTSWRAMGEGTDNGAITLCQHQGALVVGGWFHWAGEQPAANIAYWHQATADFNGDGDVATDQDIEAFFACLGGSCCPTCPGPDFNGDGDLATDEDIESFFRVFSGGPC